MNEHPNEQAAASDTLAPLSEAELETVYGGMSTLFLYGDTAIIITADATSSKVWTVQAKIG